MGEINMKALRGPNAKPPKPDDGSSIKPEDEYGPKARSAIKKFAGAYYSGALKDLGQFNPYKISYEQLYMMRTDSMIRMGLEFIISPLASAPWRCEGPDAQQNAFVENALKDIYTSLIASYFTKLDFGHAAIIKRFKRALPDWTYTDPVTHKELPVWNQKNIQAIVWNDPRALPPETCIPAFLPDGVTYDGFYHKPGSGMIDPGKTVINGGQLMVTPDQNALKGYEQIPVGHTMWAINERERSFGNWAGYPRTGYSFRYWWSYWFRYILADRHFEQDADPPMKITYPPGFEVDAGGNIVQNVDAALAVADSARAGSSIALPSTPYTDDLGKPTGKPMWDAEFMQGGENMAVYLESFDDLRVMKLRSLLVPEQALIEGKGGTSSRNVGATFGKVFTESLGILMNEFDRDINQYWIPDLLKINFTKPATVTKVTTGFRSIDIQMGATILGYIANQAGKDLPIDMDGLLDELGIPRVKVSPLETQDSGLDPATDLIPIPDPNNPVKQPPNITNAPKISPPGGAGAVPAKPNQAIPKIGGN